MPSSARVNDLWMGICCHSHHSGCVSMGGWIVSGSTDAKSAGGGQAAVPDTTIGWCGHTGKIVTGFPNSLINNKPNATVGSIITGSNIGFVITGSPKHNVN